MVPLLEGFPNERVRGFLHGRELVSVEAFPFTHAGRPHGSLCLVLGLELKGKATALAPTTEGVSFLGYTVFGGEVRLCRRSRVRLGRGISRAARLLRAGQGDAAALRASIATRLNHAATGTHLDWRRAVARRIEPQ